jgi:hypothetical protein
MCFDGNQSPKQPVVHGCCVVSSLSEQGAQAESLCY